MDVRVEQFCDQQDLGFEIKRAKRRGEVQPYFSYRIRRRCTGEVLIDGYAADVHEAAQSVVLNVQYLAQHPEFA